MPLDPVYFADDCEQSLQMYGFLIVTPLSFVPALISCTAASSAELEVERHPVALAFQLPSSVPTAGPAQAVDDDQVSFKRFT